MDFGKFFAGVAKRRQTSIIRKWAKIFMTNPSLITLANGMPNSGTFPFEEISVTYKGGNVQKFVGKELHLALQYGITEGYTPLIKQMREFQVKWHSPKANDWDVIFTPGSQDAAIKVFEMVLDIGDVAMVQSPCYAGTINAV